MCKVAHTSHYHMKRTGLSNNILARALEDEEEREERERDIQDKVIAGNISGAPHSQLQRLY